MHTENMKGKDDMIQALLDRMARVGQARRIASQIRANHGYYIVELTAADDLISLAFSCWLSPNVHFNTRRVINDGIMKANMKQSFVGTLCAKG